MNFETLFAGRVGFLDLEYTSWEGSVENKWSRPGEFKEIVEIGALKATYDSGRILNVDKFNCLVLPVLNPVLSDYFIQLTGISQVMLTSSGVDLAKAKEDLIMFIQGCTAVFTYGEDWEVFDSNLNLRRMSKLPDNPSWVNYRPLFEKRFKVPHHISSGDLLAHFGFTQEASTHRAMHDVMSQFNVINCLLGFQHGHE